MKLPIVNRKWTIIGVIVICILLITFSFLIQDITKEWRIISVTIIVMGVLYIFKNNIQKASLKNDTIILKYNWIEIVIPVNEIISINSAISGFNDFKNPWTTFFILELKKKYRFGRKLQLEYRHQDFKLEEPREISIIKAIVENTRNIDSDTSIKH